MSAIDLVEFDVLEDPCRVDGVLARGTERAAKSNPIREPKTVETNPETRLETFGEQGQKRQIKPASR